METLENRQERQVYLITYSRADVTVFPTRESFANAVVCAFEKKTHLKVEHWVVSREQHSDDNN